MKKFLFVLCMLTVALVCFPVMAQTIGEQDSGSTLIGLTSFTAIVALVSFLITWGMKYISFVGKNSLTKILCSVIIGILATLLAWWLGIADFLTGLPFLQAVIQGIYVGLSACGFYDLLKTFGLAVK